MPIYHLSVKPIQRSKGRSSVAAAAYRAGVAMTDRRTGVGYDYARKTDVICSFMIGWAGSRDELWNKAEQVEVRKDATTAREYEVALPKELNWKEQLALTNRYAQWLFDEYGVAVDTSIHEGKWEEGAHSPVDYNGNIHAHILTTTRIVEGGRELTDKSAREWSDARRKKSGLLGRKTELIKVREKWGAFCNAALAEAGCSERIDHRSNIDRGLDIPPQIHVGAEAFAIHKKGGWSNRYADNVEIRKAQQEIKSNLIEIGITEKEVQALKERFRAEKEALKKQATPLSRDEMKCKAQDVISKVSQKIKELRLEKVQIKAEDLVYPTKPIWGLRQNQVKAKIGIKRAAAQFQRATTKVRAYRQKHKIRAYFRLYPKKLKDELNSSREVLLKQRRQLEENSEKRKEVLVNYRNACSAVDQAQEKASKLEEQIEKWEVVLVDVEKKLLELESGQLTKSTEQISDTLGNFMGFS